MAMPRHKRTSRRRHRRVHRRKRAPTNKTLNKKIKNIENNLMELKYKEFFGSSVPIDNVGTASWHDCSLISLGNTANTRIGRSVTPTSLLIRFRLVTDPDRVTSNNLVRFVVLWDSQPNGAVVPFFMGTPAQLSVFDNTNTSAGTLAHKTYETRDRYKILVDRIYNLETFPEAATWSGGGILTTIVPADRMVTMRIPLHRQIIYKADAGTISDLSKNNLVILWLSNVTTDTPLVSYVARLYYRDS